MARRRADSRADGARGGAGGQLTPSGLAVVVPAKNEALSIGPVVAQLVALGASVFVVDDGSGDGTGDLATAAGATVLRNDVSLGYDGAIARGLNHAFASGATAVATCDADGQHRPPDVLRVASLVLGGEADFATGLRNQYNRTVERITGALSAARFGSRDPFCGLKVYGPELARRVGTFPAAMHVGTLPLVWVRRYGLRARFVDITVDPRSDGKPRFGRRVSADVKLVRAFGASYLASFASR